MADEKNEHGLTMKAWLKQVDVILQERIGVSHSDLADFDIWDCWSDGMSPEEGAYECMNNDDLPWEELARKADMLMEE
jgi:hypothetical protein